MRFASAAALFAAAAVACRGPDMGKVRESFYAGDYPGALEKLEEFERDDSDNRHRWQLEKSIVQLAQGDADGAAESLRAARDRMKDFDRYDHTAFTSVSRVAQSAQSVLTDDNALDYEPRDYETQLVYAMLAALELVRGGGDAQAYSLQGLERAQTIQADIAKDTDQLYAEISEYRDLFGDNPKETYRLVGFGDFVRATLLEESPTRVSEAERAYVRAFQFSPDYPYVDEDLARVRGEVRPADGTGALWILTLTGRGPFLEETVVAHPSEALLLILKQIWSYQQDRITWPIVTGIRVPELRFYVDNPADVHVEVDGAEAGVTGTLTDIEKTAEIEFDAMHDMVVARAVFRRAVKLVMGEVVKDQVEATQNRGWESLLIDLGVAIWSGTERADLRSWSLLPARLQALRVELPPGTHTVRLRAGNAAGAAVGPPVELQVRVQQGYNTYLLGMAPTLHGVPTALSSATVEPEPEPDPEPAPAP